MYISKFRVHEDSLKIPKFRDKGFSSSRTSSYDDACSKTENCKVRVYSIETHGSHAKTVK